MKTKKTTMMMMMMVYRGLLLPASLCVACSLGLVACDDPRESADGENGAMGAAAAAAGVGGDAESVPAAAAFVSLHRFPAPFYRHILDRSGVGGGGGGVSTAVRGSRVPKDSHHHHNKHHHHHHVRYMRALYQREADENGRPRGGPSAIPGNTARLIPPAELGRAPRNPAATAEVATFDLSALPRGELLLRAALVAPGDALGRSTCSLRVLPRNDFGANPNLDPDLNPNPETTSRASADPSRNPRPQPEPHPDSNPGVTRNLTAEPAPLSNGNFVTEPELEASSPRVSLGEWFEVDVTGPVSRLLNHPGTSSPTSSSPPPALRVAWSCVPDPRRAPVPPFLLLYSDELPGAVAGDAKSEALEVPSPGFLGDIPGSLEWNHHDHHNHHHNHHPAWRLAGSRAGQSFDALRWKKQKKLKSLLKEEEEERRRRKIATMTATDTASGSRSVPRGGCGEGLRRWAPCPSGTSPSALGADGARARRRVARSLLPKGVDRHETPNRRQSSSTTSSSSSLSSLNLWRQRRRQWLSARGYSGAYGGGCRLHNLTVNFGDLGWDRWIVAPRRYEAGACRGGCPRGLLHALGAPNHAVVCTVVEEVRPGLGAGKASCVPSGYRAVSVLVLEAGGSIAYKQYQGMAALGCTCR